MMASSRSRTKPLAHLGRLEFDSRLISKNKRILHILNHYEALVFPQHKQIDATVLKKEYREKAMLVHPDKNKGSPLASESFRKLQCAYEVLSDSVKERLR